MKQLLTLLGLSLSLALGSAYAADAPATKTAQQSKMTTCNKDAGDKQLKGDERKAFMKDCLSAKPAPAPAAEADKKTTQQNKMASCNKDAGTKSLKGDERKAFMKDCLSNKG